MTNLENRVTTIEGDVSTLSTTVTTQGEQIDALDAAAVKYDKNADGSVNYDRVTLAGSSGTTISNVAAGVADTDAVNIAQLRDAVDDLSGTDDLAVHYVADSNGKATNTVALTGDGTGSPVSITNVAAGKNATDAVNYSQIENQVSYDTDANGGRTNTITLSGANGQSVRMSNLSDGIAATDAVNVRQLNGVRQDAYSYTDNRVTELRNYTDNRFATLTGDIRQQREEARGGISSAMAAAGIRYDDRPGKGSIGVGTGGFKDGFAIAGGLGYTSEDGLWRLNSAVSYSPTADAFSWNAGASWTFN